MLTSIFVYGFYTVLGISIAGFFVLDGPVIIKNSIIPRFRQANNLKQLINGQGKSVFSILKFSLYVVFKSIYIMLIQRLNKSIARVDRNRFELTYVINGTLHKILVKTKRGPRDVLLAYDSDEQDVSDLVFPYLGPQENFHNQEYTPNFWNKESLTFNMSSGEEKTFSRNEKIVLSS